ncbi:hypothetical protein G2W53_001602 [Senna tora]|uniref:Uncharacterized protein n=1 Tax=Senna tora TaxID=362788 RepID=A0A835CMP3_9FABA|nr:hypothetical protein G2W53_001602 [Senna tora]
MGWNATACYPSTVASCRFSLLCEASLTPYPPNLGATRLKPSFRSHGSTHNLEWASCCDATMQSHNNIQPP